MLNGTQCKFDQRSPRGESQQVNKSQEQATYLVPHVGSMYELKPRGQRQGTVRRHRQLASTPLRGASVSVETTESQRLRLAATICPRLSGIINLI